MKIKLKKQKTFGELVEPCLVDLEDVFIDYEANHLVKPRHSLNTFRAVSRLFASVMIDKIDDLQEKEGIDFEDRMKMCQKFGEDFSKLIKIYADIDTKTLY